MRVLFLGPGTAVHVTRWVEHLRARGHEVLLASMHPVPASLEPRSQLLTENPRSGPTSAATLVGAVRKTRELYRRSRPDVVCAYYMASYGLLAALSGVRPWVGAAAGGDVLVDPFDGLATRLRNGPVMRLALHRAAGMLAWAPHVGQRLESLGVPPRKILVQPRGVNQSLFGYRPPRERDPRDPLRIVSLRWLKPLYRIDTLVEAVGHLLSAGVPFELRIIGDGPERSKLEALARARRVHDHVTFLGAVEPDTIPEALRWADVYVSTSSSDGASSSLFEAMSVGALPVVTDIPANRHLIDAGHTGELFPVGDAEGLADRLAQLARDDARRRRGIERARSFAVEHLDYDRNMLRIESFLEAVARGSQYPSAVHAEPKT